MLHHILVCVSPYIGGEEGDGVIIMEWLWMEAAIKIHSEIRHVKVSLNPTLRYYMLNSHYVLIRRHRAGHCGDCALIRFLPSKGETKCERQHAEQATLFPLTQRTEWNNVCFLFSIGGRI